MAWEYERRPDAGRFVLVVELVAQGLVQRDESGLGSIVVGYSGSQSGDSIWYARQLTHPSHPG